MTEFYGERAAPPLGDPATDPVLTVRVHPDDDPRDPAARRVLRTDWPRDWPWLLATGWSRAAHAHGDQSEYRDSDVATWPVQHWLVAATVFRHAEAATARHGRAAQPVERGDMDADAFRGAGVME